MEIRVALFEDNELFRDAIKSILQATSGFICCGAFKDNTNLEQTIAMARPDVILMDIEMPGMEGIEATRILRQKFPGIRILIQTAFAEDGKIFEAMCAGASGYILKNESPLAYLDAVQEVYNGGAPMSMSVAKQVLSFFSSKNVILVAPANEDFHLTAREKELLGLMVDGENYKSIAEQTFISYDTVRTHVRNIYQKLHVASRNEAVMKAVQQKLVSVKG